MAKRLMVCGALLVELGLELWLAADGADVVVSRAKRGAFEAAAPAGDEAGALAIEAVASGAAVVSRATVVAGFCGVASR